MKSYALTTATIKTRVAERFGIPLEMMTSPQRSRIYAHPRQIAMYLTRELTPRSFPEIGRRFGNRDHSTVFHACRTIEAKRQTDAELDRACNELAEELAL